MTTTELTPPILKFINEDPATPTIWGDHTFTIKDIDSAIKDPGYNPLFARGQVAQKFILPRYEDIKEHAEAIANEMGRRGNADGIRLVAELAGKHILKFLWCYDLVKYCDPEAAEMNATIARIHDLFPEGDIKTCKQEYGTLDTLMRTAKRAIVSGRADVLEMCRDVSPKDIVIELDEGVWSAISDALRLGNVHLLELLSGCCWFEFEPYCPIRGHMLEPQYIEEQRLVFPRIMAKQMDKYFNQLVHCLIDAENYEAAVLISEIDPRQTEYVRKRVPEDVFDAFSSDLGPKCAAKTR